MDDSFLSFSGEGALLPSLPRLALPPGVSPPPGAPPTPSAPSLPPWHIWEKLASQGGGADAYSKAMQDIATISSVSEFWDHWLAIPQPSELLEGNKIVREDPERSAAIDSLMIFREGIKPEWEDAANQAGGHFAFTFKPGNCNHLQVDEYWNNIVIAAVGGMLGDKVNGIRLVDKTVSARNACIRIEVWFRDYADTNAVAELRTNVENAMATRLDGSLGLAPRCEQKCHYD